VWTAEHIAIPGFIGLRAFACEENASKEGEKREGDEPRFFMKTPFKRQLNLGCRSEPYFISLPIMIAERQVPASWPLAPMRRAYVR
jgi:hypothetical protein